MYTNHVCHIDELLYIKPLMVPNLPQYFIPPGIIVLSALDTQCPNLLCLCKTAPIKY